MKATDSLAKAYFDKFIVRVEVLPEYHKRHSYSDVIREGQEALELFNKALLRIMGMAPTFSHDPGKELADVRDEIPKPFGARADELIKWSRILRKERELSYYGAKDFIPTQEYTKQESQAVIDFLQEISDLLKGALK